MATLFGLHPFLLKLYADGGYQGPAFQAGVRRVCRRLKIAIVKRSDQAKGFTVLPKRWIVERTIAWLNRCRRLAKDWECLNRRALLFLQLASIRLMVTGAKVRATDWLAPCDGLNQEGIAGSRIAGVLIHSGNAAA